ncbi:hypothetical protein Hypma_003849 [Hypsizygus marmoreus]|uniref:Uncharacterized protein n=1 Tax=Hypsizygus marmoreus TaxID=39966 RepID=A0A369K6R2_HYPMA|nr:hypothetical protein Hypma_003849 [Hypsizygus marmoreus]
MSVQMTLPSDYIYSSQHPTQNNALALSMNAGHGADVASISPALRLPHELMSKIFLENMPKHQGGASGWLVEARSLSQVCRSWRHTALTCPFLWNDNIDFNGANEDWIRILLQRSMPLLVSASIVARPGLLREESSPPPGWKVLFQNLDRIGQLRIVIDDSSEACLAFLLEQLNQAAPFLESLDIHVSSSAKGARFKLPASLFKGVPNKLGHVQLVNCQFESELARTTWRQLVSLTVFQAQQTPASQWLETLSALPLLQVLDIRPIPALYSDIPTATSTSQGHLRPVRLDHLSRISLHLQDMHDCVDLLHNLRFPLSCNVSIQCDSVRPGSAYFELHAFIQARVLSDVLHTTPLKTISVWVNPLLHFFTFGFDQEASNRITVLLHLATDGEGDDLQSFHPHLESWFMDPGLIKDGSLSFDWRKHSDRAIFTNAIQTLSSLTTLKTKQMNHILQILMTAAQSGSYIVISLASRRH